MLQNLTVSWRGWMSEVVRPHLAEVWKNKTFTFVLSNIYPLFPMFWIRICIDPYHRTVFNFADPDPAFHINADLDLACAIKADPDF